MVSGWDKKELNDFLKKEENILLEKQNEITNSKIFSLEETKIKILASKKELVDKKNNEITSLEEKMQNEQKLQDMSYKKLEDLDIKNILEVNTKIDHLKNYLVSYKDEMLEWVKNKINKVWESLIWLHNVDKNKLSNAAMDSFKSEISVSNVNQKYNSYKEWWLSAKQKIYWLIFVIILFYDIYFWSILVADYFRFKDISGFFVDYILVYLLAILFVFLLIAFFHFIIKFLSEKKDENKYMKQLGFLSLIVLFWVLFLYIYNSGQNISSFRDMALEIEFLMRLLIFPALIVWEYLIKEIDITSVKWQRNDSYLKKMKRYIQNIFSKLYFIYKNKSFVNRVDTDFQKVYDELDNLQSELDWIFSFKNLLDETSDIQSKLTPIYENNQRLIDEYKANKKEILNRFKEEKKLIEDRYSSEIAIIDKKISLLDTQINRISQNLGDAENNIWEWIRLGLLSK